LHLLSFDLKDAGSSRILPSANPLTIALMVSCSTVALVSQSCIFSRAIDLAISLHAPGPRGKKNSKVRLAPYFAATMISNSGDPDFENSYTAETYRRRRRHGNDPIGPSFLVVPRKEADSRCPESAYTARMPIRRSVRPARERNAPDRYQRAPGGKRRFC